jgi:hypothetical protein
LQAPRFSDISALPTYRREQVEGAYVPLSIESSAARWAQQAGYRSLDLPDTVPPERPIQDSYLAGMAMEVAAAQARTAQSHVHAEDLTCVYWNWGVRPNLPDGEVLFALISRAQTLLHDSVWAKFFPFLADVDTEARSATMVPGPQYVRHLIDEPVFLLGAGNQEGHFVMDLIPRLQGIKALGLDPGIPVIVGRLLPYQKRVIQALGLNFHFYEVAPPAEMTLETLVFKEAWYSEVSSACLKARFIDECVAAVPMRRPEHRALAAQLPKFFYLKRGGGEHPARVRNGVDVEQALNGLGFVTLSCADRSPAELITLFSNAQVVVAEPGTPLSNFLNYCPPSCYAVWMVPETVCRGQGLVSLAPVYDVLIRRLSHIAILPGVQQGEQFGWAVPHDYPVADLLAQVSVLSAMAEDEALAGAAPVEETAV